MVGVAIVLGVVARVALSAMVTPEPPGELVAQVPMGPEGGSTTFDGGGKVKIPKGALTERQTISVRRHTVPQRVTVMAPRGGVPQVFPPGTLVVYTFGPTNVVFLRPVTIVMPVPASQQGFIFVMVNGQIRFVRGAQTNRTVSVQVTSFNFSSSQPAIVGG